MRDRGERSWWGGGVDDGLISMLASSSLARSVDVSETSSLRVECRAAVLVVRCPGEFRVARAFVSRQRYAVE